MNAFTSMLSHFLPVNITGSDQFARALVALDFLLRSQFNDLHFVNVNSLYSSNFQFYDSKTLLEFYDSDLNFYLQHMHLLVMFKRDYISPIFFLLKTVLFAHCVRSVSNAEHLLALENSSTDKLGLWKTDAFKKDEYFVYLLFHGEKIFTSDMIPFVVPHLYKKNLIDKCMAHSSKTSNNLRVTVLKRVHHRKIHFDMLNIIKKSLHKKQKIDHSTNVLAVLRQHHDCGMPLRFNEFLTRLKNMNRETLEKWIKYFSTAVANTQNFTLLFKILSQVDRRFHTQFLRDFIVYEHCADINMIDSVTEAMKRM